MIRLLAVLCFGMFLTLKIGGEDRGQMRFGLIEAAAMAETDVPEPVAVVADVVPTPVVQPTAQVVEAVFTPEQPVMAEPAPQAAVVEAPASAEAEQGGEILFVAAQSVNVREGPSTDYAVLTKLAQGEAVLVVWSEDAEWARIRIEGDGGEGYVAKRFLGNDPDAN